MMRFAWAFIFGLVGCGFGMAVATRPVLYYFVHGWIDGNSTHTPEYGTTRKEAKLRGSILISAERSLIVNGKPINLMRSLQCVSIYIT